MKKTVILLFGGRSSEYEVSLSSAFGALENIDTEKYNVVKVGITREGKFYLYEGENSLIPQDKWLAEGKCTPISLDLAKGCFTAGDREIRPDAVLPMIHGKNCEDGTLQGMLTLMKIPVAGCGCTSSAVCMDKAFTKAIINSETKINQAKAVVIRAEDYTPDTVNTFREKCERELGYPVFVKPANAGSSVGVTKVKNAQDFDKAVKTALHEDEKALVEEFILGKEIEVAVLEEHGKYYAAHPAEIDHGSAEFYDYETKYISDASSYYIPARIPEKEQENVRAQAMEVFKALGCRGFSRVDFFYSEEGGFVFNEINTLPGFTPISMYPKMMVNDGISYKELISRLIEAAR